MDLFVFGKQMRGSLGVAWENVRELRWTTLAPANFLSSLSPSVPSSSRKRIQCVYIVFYTPGNQSSTTTRGGPDNQPATLSITG